MPTKKKSAPTQTYTKGPSTKKKPYPTVPAIKKRIPPPKKK